MKWQGDKGREKLVQEEAKSKEGGCCKRGDGGGNETGGDGGGGCCRGSQPSHPPQPVNKQKGRGAD